MGQVYGQLSLEERCEIARLRGEGCSVRKIAAALDRQPSSISRELRRNTGSGPRAGAYKPLTLRRRRRRDDGRAAVWTATRRCEIRCWKPCPRAGRPNRCRVG